MRSWLKRWCHPGVPTRPMLALCLPWVCMSLLYVSSKCGTPVKDKGFADMDFLNTPNKTLTPALSGYYCYINIHKRIGSDLSLESTEEKFTMQELVALDPQWKVYFQGLCDIADKYGSNFN